MLFTPIRISRTPLCVYNSATLPTRLTCRIHCLRCYYADYRTATRTHIRVCVRYQQTIAHARRVVFIPVSVVSTILHTQHSPALLRRARTYTTPFMTAFSAFTYTFAFHTAHVSYRQYTHIPTRATHSSVPFLRLPRICHCSCPFYVFICLIHPLYCCRIPYTPAATHSPLPRHITHLLQTNDVVMKK